MSAEEKAEAQALVDRVAELREKQAAMQAEGLHVKLLGQALHHLGSRQVSLNLEVAVHIRPGGPRLPIAKCRDRDVMIQAMDHAFKATIAALRGSLLQVKTFTVFNIHFGGFVTLKALHDAMAIPKSAPSVPAPLEVPQSLHNIDFLTLNLYSAPVKKIGEEQLDPYDTTKHPTYGPDSPPDVHDAYLSSLAAFIRPNAHSLRDLNIKFRGFHAIKLDCAEVFNRIAMSEITFPGLRKLHLHNIVIQNVDLLAFLRSAPALTHLGLHKVSLPHNPSHPRKLVEYPNSHPQWSQMEPDVDGWKDGWSTVFDAFVNADGGTETLLPPPCPRLEILEINSLHLTSFEQRIYFTAPHSAMSAYVKSIMDDEALREQLWYKISAFQEGLACCVFTGEQVRGEVFEEGVVDGNDEPEDLLHPEEVADENGDVRKKPYTPPRLENGLYVPLPPPPSASVERPRGIQYKVSTTRPYGSPAYYQWLHFWEATEFGEMGCAPGMTRE